MPTNSPEHLVITDLSLGDDLLAVLAVLALDAQKEVPPTFIASFGNRSTGVCFENLRWYLRKATSHLKNLSKGLPLALYGADKSRSDQEKYYIPDEDIRYKIHGDMGFDHQTDPEVRKDQMSQTHYHQVIKGPQSVQILSLAATTELTKMLRILAGKSLIESVVIMGGTLKTQGNTGSYLEANFTHDPESNREVFSLLNQHKTASILVPLDATEQKAVLFTPERIRFLQDQLRKFPWILAALNSVVGPDSVYGSFYFSRSRNSDSFPYSEGGYQGIPVHDLTAALVEYDFHNGQRIFEYADVPIQVDGHGQVGVARPYFDSRFLATVAGPVRDYDAFWQKVVEVFLAFSE